MALNVVQISYHVNADNGEIVSLIQAILEAGPRTRKYIAAAANEATKTTRANAARRIAGRILAKKGSILRRLKIRKASQRTLSATLTMKDTQFSVASFPHRQTKQGVTVKFYQDQGRKLFAHAFVAKLRKNPTEGQTEGDTYEQVFRREIVGGKRVGRLPLQTIKGPALLQVYKRTPQVIEEELAIAQAAYVKRLRAKLEYLLSKQDQSDGDEEGYDED